jgi:Bacterial Ig-like domain (group 3)/FG-GAP-like repeat
MWQLGTLFMNNSAWLRNVLWTTCLSIAFILLGISSKSANAQGSPALFPISNPIPTDGNPVFTGDFNGDGKLDLAYVNAQGLGIVLSFGSSAATTVTTALCPSTGGGGNPYFADVNNDKKLDLVLFCTGYLTVQLGNGDGTFQAPAYLATNATGPVVFADFNGDGYLDVAALAPNSSPTNTTQVAIFLNQGSTAPGVFASPKLYAAPNGTQTGLLTAGDFNGDGKQDLMIPTLGTSIPLPSPNGFSVLYGNGDGTLNAPSAQSIAPYESYTTGDFNGDGTTDIAFLLQSQANNLFTSVLILLGSKSGTFSAGAALPIIGPAPNSPVSVFMGAEALSGDGSLDLVVSTSVLNVFHGDGKGAFTPTGSYAVANGPFLFGDVNGDGKQDLILGSADFGTFIFDGNGDGTFQAPPGAPVSGPVADVNNDGIADMVFYPAQGGNYFGTALGRGDGSFAVLNQTTPLPAAQTGYVLMTGDFNGDGKIDTIAIQPGSVGPNALTCLTPDAQLLSYLGSGDGRFQAKGTALPLAVNQAGAGTTGDFNSDGNLDIILPYTCPPMGLLFVPGHGDGTFGAPINLNASQGNGQFSTFLVGDLNNDKKLDFIWGNAVFLGNGDGTFKQIPLTIPTGPGGIIGAVALADLNGDGILDAVSGNPNQATTGSMIYAGKGDGTFAATPFYSITLPANTYQYSFATGDVNGDGNPDLLVVEQPGTGASNLEVYLGDGHGNFTQDTNTYFVSTAQSPFGTMMPTRLNNQAPPLPQDKTLDVLMSISSSAAGAPFVMSLLNQINPAPAKPGPLTSTTALQTSLSTATPGAAVTLTASVSGTNPTGSVSFAANGNALGTEVLVNGTATLPTSFANAGSYTVTATYEGDSNNTASISAAVAITITAGTSATTLQASPSAGNVNGQITLKASVTGDSPTGSVSFAAGSNSLGTATLTNGVATLQTSFAAAGSYTVTATYKGDQNNSPSTSSGVTIVIAAPDFTIAATPTSGSITPGQTATFTFTVSPVGGFAGTVKFSCGTLPSQAACSFSPASVTPSGGSPVSSTLTVTTAAATARLNPDRPFGPSIPWLPADGLALAGVMGLIFAPGRMRRWSRQLRLLSFALLLASLSLAIQGCGGGGGNSSPSNPGTPAGSYTVSVNASDSAGGPQHAMNVTLTVQ